MSISYIPHATAKFALKSRKNRINKVSRRWFYHTIAFSILLAFFVLLFIELKTVTAPLQNITSDTINLEPYNLLYYSLRSNCRMLLALVCSIIFTLIYASVAAKNKRLEQIMVPLLDILQSVPILGYLSFSVILFMKLFPDTMIGLECAAIFAFFTSQVWNITFSFYYSLKNVPNELIEVGKTLRMSAWQIFWRIEVPYALPNIMWNVCLSVPAGWFFIVATESISFSNQQILLPGIGAYIQSALDDKNIMAICYSIICIAINVFLLNKILLNPLTKWAEKFRYDMAPDEAAVIPLRNAYIKNFLANTIWQNIIVKKLIRLCRSTIRYFIYSPLFNTKPLIRYDTVIYQQRKKKCLKHKILWYGSLIIAFILILYHLNNVLIQHITFDELLKAAKLTCITTLRVIVSITASILLWLPIGIYLGLNLKIAHKLQALIQFLTAFPSNILFPVATIIILHYNLNANIWLTILMMVNCQWYILFNVIAGSSAFPANLKEVTRNFNIRGYLWWSKIIVPSILPNLVNGCITSSGAAWNASIIAEFVTYGKHTIVAEGIGSYITENTIKGNNSNILLGIIMMSLVVVIFNNFFWQPIYNFVTKRYAA